MSEVDAYPPGVPCWVDILVGDPARAMDFYGRLFGWEFDGPGPGDYYEARLRAKDGAIKHVLISSSGYFQDGRFGHSRCFTRDITERRRAEQAVRDSERQLQLVTDALVMAIWRRGKPDALLHHSDRGSQYTSEQFQRLMADSGVVCSMSRSGNVWDNAAMESFFSSLKTERTSNRTYRTRNEAKADVFDYIERFYNSKRRHSTIGYLSPMEFERQAGFA